MVTRQIALAVAAGCAALVLPAEPGRTDGGCQASPRTVSPTHSRLWTAELREGFAATPGYVNRDGSVWLKAPWFAAGPPSAPKRGPRGVLRISGIPMGRLGPPLRAQTRQVWVDGYEGSAVWAVVLTFPREGCWSIVGRANRTSYSFQLLVTKTA